MSAREQADQEAEDRIIRNSADPNYSLSAEMRKQSQEMGVLDDIFSANEAREARRRELIEKARRDDAQRRANVTESVKRNAKPGEYFYHGTTLERVPSIQQNGFTPATENKYTPSFPDFTSVDHIYFTSTPESAFRWATDVAGRKITRISNNEARDKSELIRELPVVLRFKRSSVSFAEEDPNFSEADTLRSDISIPANQIEVSPLVIQTPASAGEFWSTTKTYQAKWTPIQTFDPSSYRALTMLKPAEMPGYNRRFDPHKTLFGEERAVQRAMRYYQGVQ